MKKNVDSIALILNSAKLGGAERSGILQASKAQSMLNSSGNLTVYLPDYEIDKKMDDFLDANGVTNIIRFGYPEKLYQVSRFNFFASLSSLFKIPILLNELKKKGVFSHTLIWSNGNKVSYPLALYTKLFSNSKMIWHWRDYPSNHLINQFILKILHHSRLQHITNSESVLRVLTSMEQEGLVLYNPAGNVKKNEHINPISTLAVASMHAPWKGIHFVVEMGVKFKKELELLGIKSINIYGEQIYNTRGDHKSYSASLKETVDKSDAKSFIVFKGNRPVSEIFSESDVLIHSSIKPEPFGRVIVEAYKARVLLISQFLGGARELMADEDHLLIDENPETLFEKIKFFCENKDKLEKTLNKQLEKSLEIEQTQERQFLALFDKVIKK